MGNMTTTEIDTGDLQQGMCEFEDGLLTLGGADLIKKGTILARHSGTLKFSIFVKGGSSNENGIPKAVMSHDLDAAASGDFPVRPIISGPVNRKRLIIDADGDDTNIDAKVVDQLRDYKITAGDVGQLGGALFTDEDS